MFGLFPFLFNNNSNNRNITDVGFSNNIINDMIDRIMSDDFISDLTNNIVDEYKIDFRDFGDYYLIKGYLPGITAKDVSIDFEKNKAILTIKKKQMYSGGNTVMTVIQTGGSLTKNFYIEDVDVTKLRASFDNNVLIIAIPKKHPVEKVTEAERKSEPVVVDVENFKVE